MSVVDSIFSRFGYTKARVQTVEKADTREGLAQDPMALAYQALDTQSGLRTPNNINLETLRRMSLYNWVDRTCITTLRDEVGRLPWDIVPVNAKKPYSDAFQRLMLHLLQKPNKNNENWRTLIDKVLEDILVIDAGCIEKVRNGRGQVVELYHVDGATVRPVFDEHGVVGDPAYEQYLPGQKDKKPVAQWANEDLVRIQWNPQGSVKYFGWGMSPVEAGLSVGTAFLYAEAYNLGFFRHNTLPPVVINVGKDVARAEVDRFKAFMAAEMMGPDGYFKPMIGSFSDGFDVKELMKAPSEMGFKDYVEWQMRWKVALYRMNPQDIGFSLDQYKAEGQVQQQLSKNKAIESLKNVIAQYITIEILGDDGYDGVNDNLQFQWIDDEALNPLDQAKIDDIYLRNGKNSINEVRRRDGEDPIVGGEKPIVIAGSTIVPLDPTPVDESDGDGSEEDKEDQEKEVHKTFAPQEGLIVPLAGNETAVAWMDDRGVTQPLFVTDFGKTRGFTVKPSFLDDRKEQEPPEQQVAEMLRLMKVNTPEVRILSGDEVLKLLPESLYSAWTNYLTVTAPYDSQEWRQRWGDTRRSPYYIVTGFVSARDLGNDSLQNEMATSPESFSDAVSDLARVWLSEMRFRLGDRKPGHYLISQAGHGFGVDYQFYQDPLSWQKSRHFLPATLKAIHPSLFDAFVRAVYDQAQEFGGIEKSFPRVTPADWTKEDTLTDIERRLAVMFQKKLTTWYRKAVHVRSRTRPFVRKADGFDPQGEYITNGVWVYQNGVKYPLSVVTDKPMPSAADLAVSPADYRDAFDYGTQQVKLTVESQYPDISVHAPELYAPMFEKRTNFLAGQLNDSMKQAVDGVITRGIDQGMTYGQIADGIRTTLGVDPKNPDFPQWRAERIARTESMWAINEGMRQQYQSLGVQKVNVDIAATACPVCEDIASGNPYTVSDAEGLIPAHPACRCLLTGDYTDLLKALPNVANEPREAGFVDGDQQQHPVKGEPAFISYGELLSVDTRQLLAIAFQMLARTLLTPNPEPIPALSEVSQHTDLKMAVSYATQLQTEHPEAAYAVLVRPDGFGGIAYAIYAYEAREAV